MKKISLLTIILCLLTNIGFSKGDFSRKAEFKKRKLLIVLYEEDASIIEEFTKIGDQETIEIHKENTKKYNDNITSSFKTHWEEKSPEFLKMSEFKTLTNGDLEAYSVLTVSTKTRENIDFFVFTLSLRYPKENKKGEIGYYTNKKSFNVNIQNQVPSMGDLLFLVTKMKMYFGVENVFDRNNLEELLKNKTLLIDKNITKLTESEIKENYLFPFKITTAEEIQELADNKDNNSLYFKIDIIYKDKMALINFMIIECETGKILSRWHMGGLTKVSYNGPSNNHLKKYSPKDRHGRGVYDNLGIGFIGPELARLYTKKVKLQKYSLKAMSSEKKQLKSKKRLMIY